MELLLCRGQSVLQSCTDSMGSTWTSAGELLQAPGAAEVRELMKGYAQAAQAHDITNPYFALKVCSSHGRSC